LSTRTFWSRKNDRAFLPRSWMMTSRKRVGTCVGKYL
jgi:hypothetical protein